MKLFKLIGLQLKVNFGLSALAWYAKNDFKKFASSLGIMAIIALAFGPLLYMFAGFVGSAVEMTQLLGQPGAVLAMVIVTSSTLGFLSNLGFVMSVFYFANDIPRLVPLPLKPREILAAKFSVVLLYNYLILAPFFLGSLLIYGTKLAMGVGYWVTGLVVYLLLPIFPLVIASGLMLLMMWLTNLGKNKDTLRLIGMILLLTLTMAMNYALTRMPEGDEAELIQRIFSEDGLIHLVSRMYPPALFATRALTAGGGTGLLNLAFYLSISLGGLLLLLWVGQQIFYRGLIGGSEIQKGAGISRESLEQRLGTTTTPVWAIAMREIKYLVRIPIYLFNSIIVLALIPLIFVMQLTTMNRTGLDISAYLDNVPILLQVLAGAGFIGVMALFTPAASSSFSREGTLFTISRLIPVAPQQQIQGKILYSYLIASLALPLVAIAALLFLPWGFPEIMLALLGGLVLSFPAITISLLIDLLRPYLTWDNPARAIKQNINVVLAMAVGGGLYYLLFLAGQAVYTHLASFPLVFAAVIFLAALAGGICYGVLMKIAPGRYRDIQV